MAPRIATVEEAVNVQAMNLVSIFIGILQMCTHRSKCRSSASVRLRHRLVVKHAMAIIINF